LTRLARLSPLVGASLLAAAACGASALLASGLILVLEPAGWLALPLAAALGMLVLLLPLAALLLKLARDLERSRQLLAQLDTQDTLTGVSNRAHFMALAEREWARSRRYGSGAAVLLIEVDRLRRLGEVRGAAAADAVLRELAHTIAKTLRGADALARYSSAQLAVFLAQADATGALDAAERIRENAEQLDVTWQDNRLRVTVSLGVAMLRPAHQNLQSLLADAQMALDASRHSGGNCVRAAPIDPARLPTRGPSVGDNQAAGPV
jgi:diguanylate cyclase (GGDEF)-like protein